MEREVNLSELEAEAARAWRDAGAYDAEVQEGRPKFFATYPYSYMNAYAHIGHAYTMSRVDFFVRYQRMLGKNTLYPFAYHVTGTPIVAAANRVRDGEEAQIRILEQQGIPSEEIPKFADPEHWVRYFPKEWRQDVQALGLGIDWRREFHTTDMNPHYDAFIRWQFRKLIDAGLVERGRHPVIWCPKDEAPIADHDRYSGEGETPQEYTLVKFPHPEEADTFLVAATLRPETMFGQTNVWIHPELTYRRVRVPLEEGREETWIVVEDCVGKLEFQHPGLVAGDPIPGRELLGLKVKAPARNAEIPLLPATFIKPEKGTGVVTSVPSDAPDDWIALLELKRDPERLRAFGLDPALVEGVEPIPIIDTPGYGPAPAVEVVEQMGITSQSDREKLDKAKEEVYQAGFYQGKMALAAGEFAGLPVKDAKEQIKAMLVDREDAALYYEPTGPVVCRCLTPATVKIVTDQWFIRYGDPEWKAKTEKALAQLRLYPEIARKQFEYVVGWLRDWACARERGLGTKLPADERWIIESLSDSTIYMSYYTFAHLIEDTSITGHERKGVKPEDLTDAFFDHVLLGEGSAEDAAQGTVTPELASKARESFSYWYPLDFRNSGKDLVQNHLTFMLFNHTAIWDDPAMWPQGIGVNGWVTVDGEKMSKSRGNFITLREALKEYGVSATRFALAYAGEGLDDANFDREFAQTVDRRLRQWVEFATGEHDTRQERQPVDAWFRSTLHRILGEVRDQLGNTFFRSSLKTGYFDLQREWAWYLRRVSGVPHADVLDEFIRVQNAILTPVVPHVAEAVHRARGGTGLAVDQAFPEVDEAAINPQAEGAERFVRSVLDDVKEILKVTGIEAKKVILYTSPEWKRTVEAEAVRLAKAGDLTVGNLMKAAMQHEDVRKAGKKDAPKLAGDLVKSLSRVGDAELEARGGAGFDETDVLRQASSFLAGEVGAPVDVYAADADGIPDPAGKARHATPGRPAIYVE